MKKKYLASSLLALSLCAAPSWAGESKAGGLELSGNIDVVTGWQRDDSHALGTYVGGQLGYFRGSPAAKHDTFNFYLDQVELDLNKSFGDNIRIRADLDFGRGLSGSGRNTDTTGGLGGFEVEQGYVTADIMGAELMVGRFNAPIGYYVVDRADNPTISFSTPFHYLTPTNVTGAKLYYAFNDNFDLHVYAVNNLADSVAFGFARTGGTTPNPGGLSNYSAIPSYGTRLGFNWGADDTKSTIGISYAGGPERLNANKHLTHIADLDFAIKATPQLLFAGEAVYRQDNSDIAGVQNDRALGGFLVVNYDFNDAWRIFGRYGYLRDRNGFYTDTTDAVGGINIHDGAIGVGYQIAEGAKLKAEYSPTFFDPKASGVDSSWSHAFSLELAYNF